MRLATVAQTKEIDQRAQRERGLSAEIMMEAAGAIAAREIAQAFLPEILSGRGVAVVCGPGGNGADGLVVARHLRAAGVRAVSALLCAPEAKRTDLFRVQLNRFYLAKGAVVEDALSAEGRAAIAAAGVAVDALFGVGLNAALTGPAAVVARAMNARRDPVVSLDVPSGLDADRGISELAVRAAMTVCFGLSRPGYYVSDGPSYVGRLRRVPIGVPQDLAIEVAANTFAFGPREAARARPRRSATSNKSSHGRALILAGHRGDSGGMWGAGLLASAAAYRAGAGFVTWASWTDPSSELSALPEALTASISPELLARKWGAIAIGPGLGADHRTAAALLELKRGGHERVLVDADALAVARDCGALPFPGEWIATPHAGELGRLLGAEAKEIESNRFYWAERAARELGCRVVLKGFRTVVANPEGRRAVVLAGNSALAKAGTGDVLSGAIAGLLAQGLAPDAAATLGAYAHGLVADRWTRAGLGRGTLTASDVRDGLTRAFTAIESGRAP